MKNPKLNTQFIRELRAKQKAELDKAIAKENEKLQKLHRNFSETILAIVLSNDNFKAILENLRDKNLNKYLGQLLEIYDTQQKENNKETNDVKK